jgi:hypothetical protein
LVVPRVQNVEILAEPAGRSTFCTHAVQNVDHAARTHENSTFCTDEIRKTSISVTPDRAARRYPQM